MGVIQMDIKLIISENLEFSENLGFRHRFYLSNPSQAQF